MTEELDDILSRLKRMRAGIKSVTGRPQVTIKDTIGLMRENFAVKLYNGVNRQQNTPQQEASQPNPQTQAPIPQGTPQELNTPRRPLLGILRGPQPSQQPPPLTEEQKKEMAEQEQLKKLEDKQQAAKAKRKRLDNMRGLAVDRT